MIDVNAYLHRWPFGRLPLDRPTALVNKLRSLQIEQAWVGSLDALLHEDVAAVNARLADDCERRGEGMLVPFGTVNPRLPDWREDLRRCVEVHRMPGVRLHPNYHGYRLDDPPFVELLEAIHKQRLVVQIALKMEDERTQHPTVRVPTVDITPLSDLLPRFSGLKVVLLNAMRDLLGESLSRLLNPSNVSVEIAMLEGVGGISNVLRTVSAERLLLGTYAPVFVPESAVLKLKESDLRPHEHQAVSRDNAQRLLPAPKP